MLTIRSCQILNGIVTRYFATQKGLSAELTAAGFEIVTKRLLRGCPEGSDMLEMEARKNY